MEEGSRASAVRPDSASLLVLSNVVAFGDPRVLLLLFQPVLRRGILF
jgi:hypothetical protein